MTWSDLSESELDKVWHLFENLSERPLGVNDDLDELIVAVGSLRQALTEIREESHTGGSRKGVPDPVRPAMPAESPEIEDEGRSWQANLCVVSPDLQPIVGSALATRTDVVSKVWSYVVKNELRSTENKRQIRADGALARVLGKETGSMFELAASLDRHLTPGADLGEV